MRKKLTELCKHEKGRRIGSELWRRDGNIKPMPTQDAHHLSSLCPSTCMHAPFSMHARTILNHSYLQILIVAQDVVHKGLRKVGSTSVGEEAVFCVHWYKSTYYSKYGTHRFPSAQKARYDCIACEQGEHGCENGRAQ